MHFSVILYSNVDKLVIVDKYAVAGIKNGKVICEAYFCFLIITIFVSLYLKSMSNSIYFYEKVFFYVIHACIIVPWFCQRWSNVETTFCKVVLTLLQHRHRHYIKVVKRWKSKVQFYFIFCVKSTLFQRWSTELKRFWSTKLNQHWLNVEILNRFIVPWSICLTVGYWIILTINAWMWTRNFPSKPTDLQR